MRIKTDINDYIFRGYDIRGIYEKDLDEDVAYTIGLAFGTKLVKERKNTTVIGYDNRSSSPFLFKALAKGINETGVDVINIGLVTTPMYYYALKLFKTTSGIMITASHNPKEYNGFKMSFNGIYNTYGEYIQEFKELVKSCDFIQGKDGKIITKDIKNDYLDYILESISFGPKRLKVVVDCGNGTTSVIAKELFDRLNIDYIPLFFESDPNFPNHHPDPSVPENLIHLKETVKEVKADLGIAFDGDGDRVGVVSEKGEMINVDLLMVIFIRDLLPKLKDKRILFDVKCSKALKDEIVKLGGIPIQYRTGNSYLRAKVVEDNIKFGGELSGHIFFNDKFYGADDGFYAALRILEILTNTDKTISELLEGVNKYYSTPEIKLSTPDNIKFEKIEKVKQYCEEKGYKTLAIDGCKVLFDDGFALIRASNTGPNITLRFEAKTEERLNEIRNEFLELMKTI
ncbi:MAG TPA: phosphomannomutase/phosphoglucomutase [Tenericutes bacterium]|nr:phosphomannomutase/phosphoglucomutase [Mycoplasmatota bacterium]